LTFKAEYSEEKSAWANETIALVRIQGTIDDKVARETSQIFRKIKKDDNVKAVVIRVDSPGGSVTASETILQECKDLPQVSLGLSAESICCLPAVFLSDSHPSQYSLLFAPWETWQLAAGIILLPIAIESLPFQIQ
jgi:protease-4